MCRKAAQSGYSPLGEIVARNRTQLLLRRNRARGARGNALNGESQSRLCQPATRRWRRQQRNEVSREAAQQRILGIEQKYRRRAEQAGGVHRAEIGIPVLVERPGLDDADSETLCDVGLYRVGCCRAQRYLNLDGTLLKGLEHASP